MMTAKKTTKKSFREVSNRQLDIMKVGTKEHKKFMVDDERPGKFLRMLANDKILTVREYDILDGMICQNLTVPELSKHFDLTNKRIIQIYRKGLSRIYECSYPKVK